MSIEINDIDLEKIEATTTRVGIRVAERLSAFVRGYLINGPGEGKKLDDIQMIEDLTFDPKEATIGFKYSFEARDDQSGSYRLRGLHDPS